MNDACAACHVYSTGFDPISGTANVGHTFLPRVEACQNCHGTYVTSFDDIMAKKDFDADGSIESIRAEVSGLMDLLATTIYNADVNHDYMGTDPNAGPSVIIDSLSATEGDTSALAVKLRTSGFNLVYVFDDASGGIHNPAYEVQLLQQSILYLDPNALPSGAILKERKATNVKAIAMKD